MSISISVPIDAVQNNERIATALSELMLALGEAQGGGRRARGTRAGRSAAKTRAERAIERASSDAPFDRKRYDAFVKSLPERSQEFVALVEAKGRLNIRDAMTEMGITQPKALGGITGSIARWAPVRGVNVPIEAGKDKKGERFWRWTA